MSRQRKLAGKVQFSPGARSPHRPLTDSTGPFRTIQQNLLKRLSRDSAWSDRTSNSKSLVSHSQDSVDRRKELRRALHRRLTEELLEEKDGKQPSESAYDDDAQVVKTPQISVSIKGRIGEKLNEENNGEAELDVLQRAFKRPELSIRPPSSRYSIDGRSKVSSSKGKGRRKGVGESHSSWETDLPSTGLVSRQASKTALKNDQTAHNVVPDIPDIPDAFRVVHEQHLEDDGISQIQSYKGGEAPEGSTNSLCDDVFKPLEDSPQRPRLWFQHSSNILVGAWSVPGLADGGHSGHVGDFHSAPSIATQQPDVDGLDGSRESVGPNQADSTKGSPVQKSFVQRARQRYRNNDHKGNNLLASPVSLPSLRKTFTRKSVCSVTSITPSFRTAPPASASRLRQSKDEPPVPIISLTRPSADIDTLGQHVNLFTPVKRSPQTSHPSKVIVDRSGRREAHHTHSTSFQSETDSYRAREIAAAQTRITSNRWKACPPRTSKFREEIDEDSVHPDHLFENGDIAQSSCKEQVIVSFDGSTDNVQKLIKRSYTVSDLIKGQNQDASKTWEKALKEHAYEVAHKHNETKKGSHQAKRDLPHSRSRKQSKDKTAVSPVPPSNLRTNQHDDEVSPGASPVCSLSPSQSTRAPGSVSPPFVNVDIGPPLLPFLKTSGTEGMPKAWARFPTHDREERNGTAGTADSVDSFDFGSEAGAATTRKHLHTFLGAEPIETRVESSDRFAGSMSLRVPARVMHLAHKLRRSISTEMRRSARLGIRSSISAGGEVHQPELELLPLSNAVFRQHRSGIPDPDAEDLDLVSGSMVGYMSASESMISSEGTEGGPAPPPASTSTSQVQGSQSTGSAHAWARMYHGLVGDIPKSEESLSSATRKKDRVPKRLGDFPHAKRVFSSDGPGEETSMLAK